MKIAIYILLFFFLFADISWSNSAVILNEENLPPEFKASYNVYKGAMHVGEMQVSLGRNNDQVIYESITNPVGLAALLLGEQEVTDRAELLFVNGHYRAVEFKHEIKGSNKNRNEHYIFDWENNKVSAQYQDKKNIFDLPPYTFDNFSAQLLMMREPSFKNSKNIYSVISRGSLKKYIYKLEGNETIETKLGNLKTNKYIREKNNEKKTTYLAWYAESLNYIPVRLDKIENGEIYISIQITEVNWQ